jgi:putative CRISPR-associated protein (TIGR02619 family)
MMRNTLICTVGTSLLNNLRKAEDASIKQGFEDKNWKNLSLLLVSKLEPSDYLCGAEINSITSICKSKVLQERERLIFLVSDTDDGKDIGKLLKLYYQNRENPLQFKSVEARVLAGLRDDSVKAFKQEGLKNLVREISHEVRKFSPETIAINATGGYKAQISFAGTIGQALEIPVYYLFEKFSEVIELPPQPVALDLALWLNNYSFFAQLESDQTLRKSDIETPIDNKYFSALVDEEVIDGVAYVTLSAMGVLFNERSRLQFAKQESTILSVIPQDDTPPEKKPINLREDHGKDVLEEFAKKIVRSPYVKNIVNSLPFNPKRSEEIRRTKSDGIVEFVLTWTDAGYGLCIQTTGRNQAETNTIALHLKNEYSQKF